ncbi:Protein F14E5.1 [Aphelenchoides avenae]|nr:Protein F14E5.1 [Aphelenchus avenae]
MLAPHGRPLRIIALFGTIASLTNFYEGYSGSYPNTAGDSFKVYINESFVARGDADGISEWTFTWWWSLFLNIWFVGYLLGTFMTPYVADTYGRKKALLSANAVSFAGTVISVIAIPTNVPELLLVGRVVASAASGLSFGALILFLQEATPTKLRGTSSFLSETAYIAMNVVGMGFGMDIVFGRNLVLLLGIGTVVGLVAVIMMIPMKETPKFLLMNRNDPVAAKEALIFYSGRYIDHEYVLREMMKESDDRIGLPLSHALREVIRQPYLRKATTIGILSLQIVVGIWPIIFISTDLLEAHFEAEMAQWSSFAFITANFFASLVGMCVVEKCGRRPLLIWCGIANTVCLAAYVFFDRMAEWYAKDFRYGCVAALVLYGVTYGAALGPIAFFITSELVPQRFRSLVQSIVFAFNTTVNFAFSFVTLPLYRWIGVWAFIPLFIVPSTLAIAYLIWQMPETKGREIHEIVGQLIRSSSKLSQSSCLGIVSSPTAASINPSLMSTTSADQITTATFVTIPLSEEDEIKSSGNYGANLAISSVQQAVSKLSAVGEKC